ncbi:MAG: hypothetical protein K1060chlam1_01437 [Candidatus Anoxychlamydiales bacterium]|nr:hypothetical protein [Candidatus Anoxychlamydiales bacterium]
MILLPFILNIPKHIWFFFMRCSVAVLNLIPLPWIKICSNKCFSDYSPFHGGSSPKRYLIESPLSTIHLGNLLVAFIRNSYQKNILYKIEEITENTENHYKKDHKIISKSTKRAVLDTDLREIIHDFKIVKRQK